MTDTTDFPPLPPPDWENEMCCYTDHDMRAYLRADRASRAAARELSDQEIIDIRDSLLPSQGNSFDTLAFARAVLAAAHSAPAPADDVRAALAELVRLYGQEKIASAQSVKPAWEAARRALSAQHEGGKT